MVTNLHTFGYDPANSRYRDRVTTQTELLPTLYNSITGTSVPLASGSYKRIIDDNTASYFYRSKRNQKAATGRVNNGVFLDTGGPLWIEEFEISRPPVYSFDTIRYGGLKEVFSGPFIVDSQHYSMYKSLAQDPKNAVPMLGLTGFDFSSMVQYGSTGISRSIPSVPETSVFTILGELREGLAAIPGRQAYKLFKEAPKGAFKPQLGGKAVGSEFLNWIFGISPTLSDAEGLLAINTDGVQAIRRKLNSDFRQDYRRRRTLLNEASQTITQGAAYPQFTPSNYLIAEGWQRTVETTTRRVWFSGSFNHSAWTPTLNLQIDEALRKGEDLGLLPNAERIWQLVPYSWLVDWFLGTGEFLTNISYLGHSGLTLSYAYVMAETTRTRTCTWTGRVKSTRFSSSTTTTEKVKQRMKASPYGFGLKVSDLSPTQMAILASLGISRTKLLKTGVLKRA